MRNYYTFVVLYLAGILLSVVAEANAQARFRVVDLGAISVGQQANVNGINIHGEIVGTFTSQNGLITRGFVHAPGAGFIPFTPLSGDNQSDAAAINRWHQAVGYSQELPGTPRIAILSHGGAPAPLGLLDNTTDSMALGINDSGEIVGVAWDPTIAIRSFYYRNGSMREISHSDLLNPSTALINNSGIACGVGATSNYLARSFLFNINTDEFTWLPLYPGHNGFVAQALSATSEVVGYSRYEDIDHTVRSVAAVVSGTPRRVTLIAPLTASESSAHDINDALQVVGDAVGSAGAFAFLSDSMQAGVNLNLLIPPGSGWHLESAHAISTRGEIAGIGLFGNERHVFVLVPLRECGWDIDADGRITASDLSIALVAFGGSSAGDTDFDHDTDLLDISNVLSHFGERCRRPNTY